MERVPNRRNQFLCHWAKNSSRFIFLVLEFDLSQEFAAREFELLIAGEFEGCRTHDFAKLGRRTRLPECRGGKAYQRTATMIRTRAAMPTMMISRSLLFSLPAAKS